MLCKENKDDLDFFLRYLMDEYMYNDITLDDRIHKVTTKYGLSMDDVYNKMDEFNNSYMNKNTDMERICIMCDSYYISNSSGVYTFIKHCVTLFNKMGYVVDFITDRPARKYVCNTVNSGNVNFHYIKDINIMYRSDYFETDVQYNMVGDMFTRYLEKYMYENKPKLIIANSLSTTRSIYNLIDKINDLGIKHIAYTHIGDLLDKNKKHMYDFQEEDVIKYLGLMENKSIHIGTQSDKFIPKIKNILCNDNIHHLPEPYYEPSDMIDLGLEKDGVIIISGNYKRKNYKDMLYLVGKMNVPVTILCSNYKNGYYDIENLIMENNIKVYNIIDNLYNDYVPMMISRHRMLLQLSEIEVFPYSVLEAVHKIPCVINKSSEWGECFVDECYKINLKDIDSELENIMNIYHNDNIKKLNLEEYQKLCYNKWYDFINKEVDNYE